MYCPLTLSNLLSPTATGIGDKRPEVLAEWRAQRAAEFVSKNAHSLEVPKHRYVYYSTLLPTAVVLVLTLLY